MTDPVEKPRVAMFWGMPVSDWKLLAVLFVAGALVAGWFGAQEALRVQHRHSLVARFQAAGLKAHVDEQGNIFGLEYIRGARIDAAAAPHEVLPHVGFLNIEDSPVTDDDFIQLAMTPNLESLNLRGTRVTDKGLAQLTKLTKLQWLNLENTAVTDETLAYVGLLADLKGLTLDKTQVTNDGLRHLKKCPILQAVYLNHTNISDGGLAHLKDIPRLQALYLAGTEISDDGVPHIAAIRHLYWLDANQTKLTFAGSAKIRAAFPTNIHLRHGLPRPARSPDADTQSSSELNPATDARALLAAPPSPTTPLSSSTPPAPALSPSAPPPSSTEPSPSSAEPPTAAPLPPDSERDDDGVAPQ